MNYEIGRETGYSSVAPSSHLADRYIATPLYSRSDAIPTPFLQFPHDRPIRPPQRYLCRPGRPPPRAPTSTRPSPESRVVSSAAAAPRRGPFALLAHGTSSSLTH